MSAPTVSGPRPVRAARGTELSTLGWQQEAALRMLQNNLDPEVAEHPDKLVVYGGTGKAARDWASFDALQRTLRTLKGDETMLVQSGRPVGVFQHPRVGAARAHRQLQPRGRLGQLGGVPPPRAPRAHDVRPDDRGLVDLHRHAGHPAGHVRDVRRRRRAALRRHAGRHHHADGGARRHGRRAAARRDDERRRRDLHRLRPARASSGASSTATSTSQADSHRARARAGGRGARRTPRPVDRPARQRGGARARSCSRMDAPIDIVTDQTSAHDPLSYLPIGVDFDDMATYAAKDPQEFTAARARGDGRPRRGDGGLHGQGRAGLRLRQLDPRRGAAGRLRARLRLPGLRPGVHPPAVLRGQGPVPLGGAVGRPGRHREDRPRDPRDVPRQREPAALDPDGAGARALPGPAGPHLLARLRRAAPRRPPVQRDGRERRAAARRS